MIQPGTRQPNAWKEFAGEWGTLKTVPLDRGTSKNRRNGVGLSVLGLIFKHINREVSAIMVSTSCDFVDYNFRKYDQRHCAVTRADPATFRMTSLLSWVPWRMQAWPCSHGQPREPSVPLRRERSAAPAVLLPVEGEYPVAVRRTSRYVVLL
ncbi:hypothetical protein NEUTE1DRAFT_62248 [Neurospora tetrasperma FGSC 2508]|uniref:Uncharacterized protein n=1 Tax=Neurospora tetrasperma (strain FGSC 2508 / ATCC MYA-4615 / P0657) TaxID=510951 RepID=F8MKC3_NEUT8|nr:uncharacterized protein NEUTE1DRAFT_62248 [Neurospora tetrasperma FGSC 2508]EGO57407.1 hypothetical protein NEUTE1DRAFT_62248 [Neurospora tetrasperma FGSC 2508]EGZ72336.1 hypothetical protein NEUTE2DRAFT_90524 [Neurospora tetrasperma FGSC 2509]